MKIYWYSTIQNSGELSCATQIKIYRDRNLTDRNIGIWEKGNGTRNGVMGTRGTGLGN